MSDLGQKFMQTNKSVIKYQNDEIYRFYNIRECGNFKLRFSFIATNSKRRQAIVICFNKCQGKYSVNGDFFNKIPKGTFANIGFWEDTAPQSFEIEFCTCSDKLILCNGSDLIGDKSICRMQYENCAMKIEKVSQNKMRFFCNDYDSNNFDDLIFEMEIIKGQNLPAKLGA